MVCVTTCPCKPNNSDASVVLGDHLTVALEFGLCKLFELVEVGRLFLTDGSALLEHFQQLLG